MYLIRDVFKTKPGQAKGLVEIFKKTNPLMAETGVKNIRVLTDVVSTYWTVIWEFEVEELNDYFTMAASPNPEITDSMKGYKDLIAEGHREIFKIE